MHTTLFCFHKIQKQVKLICSDKDHDGGYFPESRRPELGEACEDSGVLVAFSSLTCMGVTCVLLTL